MVLVFGSIEAVRNTSAHIHGGAEADEVEQGQLIRLIRMYKVSSPSLGFLLEGKKCQIRIGLMSNN